MRLQHIVPRPMWKYIVMAMACQAIERDCSKPQQCLARTLMLTAAQVLVLVDNLIS